MACYTGAISGRGPRILALTEEYLLDRSRAAESSARAGLRPMPGPGLLLPAGTGGDAGVINLGARWPVGVEDYLNALVCSAFTNEFGALDSNR